jgi:hypothetical protein
MCLQRNYPPLTHSRFVGNSFNDGRCETCGWTLPILGPSETFVPWKQIYRDRHTIDVNWRLKRYYVHTIESRVVLRLCILGASILNIALEDHSIHVYSVKTMPPTLLHTLIGHTARYFTSSNSGIASRHLLL